MLLCLGLDYKRGGFVDRALEAFNEVLRLDPKNEYALRQPAEAARRAASVDRGVRHAAAARRSWPTIDSRPQNQAILAFLENEIGLEAMRRKDYPEAIRRFEAAIDLDARAVPAYLNLGDVRVAQGNEQEAAAIWETLIEVAPDRAYLAFDRLEALADAHRQPRALHAAVPPADRREPAGLARPARAVAPPGRRAASRTRRSICCSRRSCRIRTRSASTRRSGARSASCAIPPALVDRYSELTAARGLLPRSARLHALPLPQHRAALAVPALPRLEHVRRRTHRAGAGHDGSRSLTALCPGKPPWCARSPRA